jgi:hypothetical protein
MRPFAYARANSVEDALQAAQDPGAALLAGGTELLNWLRLGIAAPDRVLDITRIAGLDRIEPLPGGGLRIGALARLGDVAADERVGRDWPVLRVAIQKSRRPSFATSRRSPPTYCRRRAAPTFAPRTRWRATAERPDQAVRPAAATTIATHCSAGPTTASPPSRLIPPSRSPLSTRTS